MVKYKGVLALKKARRDTQAQYRAGLLAIAQMIKEEEQARPLLSHKPAEDTQVPVMPWLGVGFAKPDSDTTRTPRRECPPVSTESKDVQVTWDVDTGDRAVVMSTVVVDGKGLEEKPQERKLKFQSRKRRKREKQERVQDTTASDTRLPVFTISTQPNTESFVVRPETLELPREPSLVLRKLFTRPNQAVQHAALTLGIPSVRRSKTAFSVSRIIKKPTRLFPRPKPDVSAILPAPTTPLPPPCLSELLARPKVARSHSFPLFDLLSKNCLPHRLTVEYNLFRRVKKATQARLRGLL